MEVEGHMPQVPGSSRGSTKDNAVYQGSSANTGAESQEHDIPFSATASPEHFRDQRGARVIVGIDWDTSLVDHFRQKTSLQKVQVSRQTVYARGGSVDDAFTADADSTHRSCRAFQDGKNEIVQRRSRARRRLAKTLDQVPVNSYKGTFDRGGAEVNAHRDCCMRSSIRLVAAHQDLRIIHTVCNSSDPYWTFPVDNKTLTRNPKTASSTFFKRAVNLLQELESTQASVIQEAAELCADRIARGGLVFLFGNGHSRMMCEEMTPRQGCFVGFVALVELALSNHAAIVGANGLRPPLYLENYEGYAEQILSGFHFGPGDAFIVISTSGIRPVIVEAAMGAQRRGLPVIAIVSKAHCEQAKAAHSSGKKLIDCADLIIDNRCPPGDCVVELEGLEWRTGPVSTITGAMIINMVRCATAEALLARGVKPVVLPSHQFVGNTSAHTQLEAFYEAYRKSLKHLFE